MLWTAILTSQKDLGLSGMEHVISDAHRGLQAAIRKTVQRLPGSAPKSI